MKHYNVYSNNSIRVFNSKEEADEEDNCTWWEDSYPKHTLIYRYGCWTEEEYNCLSNERDKLLAFNKEIRFDGNRSVQITAWNAYSKFWFNHRNMERGK